jgi:hypothetical protein
VNAKSEIIHKLGEMKYYYQNALDDYGRSTGFGSGKDSPVNSSKIVRGSA